MRGTMPILGIALGLLYITGTIVSAAMVTQSITYQGKLTDAAGNPLTGTYSVRFSLYDVATGGTALVQNSQSVSCTNGLFTTPAMFVPEKFDGRALWLGVQVGSDPEMTPRQEIRPVPYALSLRPGAWIAGTGTSPALNIVSSGGGPAVNISTAPDNSDGAFARTTGYSSAGFSAVTHGGFSPGFNASGSGDFASGFSAAMAGYSNDGVSVSMSGDLSDGVSVSLTGSRGKGVSVTTEGYDSRGFYTLTEGNDAEGLQVKTTGEGSDGISILTTGNHSTGVNVSTTAKNTDAIWVQTSGFASNGVTALVGNHYSAGFSATTDAYASPGVKVITLGDSSTGVQASTTAPNSAGFSATTSARSSPGLYVATDGMRSDGVNILTTGLNSNGAYVWTSEDYSPGVNVTTYGDNSDGFIARTNGANSPGLRVFTDGSNSNGISVYTTDGNSEAVYAHATGSLSPGVYAHSSQFHGIYTETTSSSEFNYGLYTPDYIYAKGTKLPAADVAEYFPVTGDAAPGTVMVIGPDGTLQPSVTAYDTRVAGIISTDPAVSLGAKDAGNPGEAPLAVSGRVPCRVDASSGAIHPGDVLTTSPTPGHAMKAVPVEMNGMEFYKPSTVLGKALGTLESGTGTIEVLVTLQ